MAWSNQVLLSISPLTSSYRSFLMDLYHNCNAVIALRSMHILFNAKNCIFVIFCTKFCTNIRNVVYCTNFCIVKVQFSHCQRVIWFQANGISARTTARRTARGSARVSAQVSARRDARSTISTDSSHRLFFYHSLNLSTALL